MAGISFKAQSERRDQVWLLMLKGYNPQQIKKELDIKGNLVYKDIDYLTDKSRKYVYDPAKRASCIGLSESY